MARDTYRKRKQPHLRELALGVGDENTVKVSERNSKQSPLLSTSPEIRNIIYGHVLGNKTIHLYSDRYRRLPVGNRLQHTICKGVSGNEFQARVRRFRGLISHGGTHDQRHDGCFGHRKERLSLALLQTCRQIHSEACLLPYATNEFSMKADLLTEFLDGLMVEQRREITHIGLSVQTPFRPSIPRKVIQDLVSVEHLDILLLETRFIEQPFGTLYDMVRLPLKRVSIVCHEFLRVRKLNPVQREAKFLEATRLERHLLQPWEEVEKSEKAARKARKLQKKREETDREARYVVERGARCEMKGLRQRS